MPTPTDIITLTATIALYDDGSIAFLNVSKPEHEGDLLHRWVKPAATAAEDPTPSDADTDAQKLRGGAP